MPYKSTPTNQTAPDIALLPIDAMLTRKQVASLSGFTEQVLGKWAREGRGPHVTTIEGRPRYRVKHVKDWIGGAASASAA